MAGDNPSFRSCEAGVELPAFSRVSRRLAAAGGRLRGVWDVGLRRVMWGEQMQ